MAIPCISAGKISNCGQFLNISTNWSVTDLTTNSETSFERSWLVDKGMVNRYRRELETCPQAKTSKSGRYSLLFFRRVRATSMTQRRVDNNRVHFWTFSPISMDNK